MTAWAVSLAAVLQTGQARAWYFPEHAELTRLALTDHAPLAVAETIDEVIHEAQHAEIPIPICTGSTTHFDAIPLSSSGAQCATYGALVGLAGDHSNDVKGLRSALIDKMPRLTPMPDVPLATLVVGAAVEVWQDFEANADAEQLRVWTSQALGRSDAARIVSAGGSISGRSPRDFVRDLDARLLVIDHGYVDRAKGSKSHFHDPTSSAEEVLRKIQQGDVDNALAQMIIHHERALQLAVAARSLTGEARTEKRIEALFEHAFALHFLEDGFAAGHIATDAAFVVDQRRAQRHDYFNRQGLATTRSIAAYRCDTPLRQTPEVRGELPTCWIAHGDGFATAEDRLFVTEAVARVQLEFALALRPRLADTIVSSCSGWQGDTMTARATSNPDAGVPPSTAKDAGSVLPSDTCDLWRAGLLLDAFPSWAGIRGSGRAPEKRAACEAIVRAVSTSLSRMPTVPEAKPRSADGTRSQADPIDGDLIGAPLNPAASPSCNPTTAPRTDVLPTEVAACEGGDVAWQVSVWRPVLAAWPAAQTDVTTLDGADALGRGFAIQAVAGTSVSAMHPLASGSSDVSSALGAGVAVGVAYRLDRVLPQRSGRSIAELNVGVAQSVRTGLPNELFQSLGFVEVRVPLFTALLALSGYAWQTDAPLEWISETWGIGLYGLRWYARIDPTALTAIAWDAEVAFLAPFRPAFDRPASIGSQMDTEFRLRVGMSRVGDRASRAGSPMWPLGFNGVPTVTVEFTGGYSSFF